MKKEWARKMTYEAMIILGVIALLTFICRLWPLLLLVMLCMLGAAIRLMFLKTKSNGEEATETPTIVPELPRPTTEQDVRELAFSVILTRITGAVKADHPDAKWVWEKPNAKSSVLSGDEAFIILNGAGGYRRARVLVENLQFVMLEYITAPEKKEMSQTETEENIDEVEENDAPVNYELMAFEWTEANIMDLNEKCNEAIGQDKDELIISADELPAQESWDAICTELLRAGLENIEVIPEGIKIKFMR